MPKYICSSVSREAWHLPSEEVAKQTFNTDDEAKQWFREQYPNENLYFEDYMTTIHLPTSFVSYNRESRGRIVEYPDD